MELLIVKNSTTLDKTVETSFPTGLTYSSFLNMFASPPHSPPILYIQAFAIRRFQVMNKKLNRFKSLPRTRVLARDLSTPWTGDAANVY